MSELSSARVYDLIRHSGLVAIVRGIKEEDLLPAAEALLKAGVGAMEVTSNTPGFEAMIGLLNREMGTEMGVGAGTITSPELAEKASQAGARFMIAPDLNPEVAAWCRERDLALIPGVATPSEVLAARRLGLNLVKLFPAGTFGPDYVRQLRGPIDDVDYLAVGGVDCTNLADFVAAGCVGAGMGSALVRRDLIAAEDWEGLTNHAAECLETLAQARS